MKTKKEIEKIIKENTTIEEIEVAKDTCSGCVLIDGEWRTEYTNEELIEGAQTNYERYVDFTDEYEDEDDYVIETIKVEVINWDNIAMWEFVARAKALGYDDAYESVKENYNHGSYMNDHGSCSMTIINSLNQETLELELEDDSIIELLKMMDCAQSRHNDTDYDLLREQGISRDTARNLI